MTRNALTPIDAPPPAPGEERSRALALVNTALEPRGRPLELLPDARALLAWLQTHGITPPRSTWLGVDGLERVQELRAAIRAVFTARARRQAPPAGALDTINVAARLAAPVSQLRWTASGPERTNMPLGEAEPGDAVLAQLAVDAIDTVTGETADQLRCCEAPGCNRLFLAGHHRRRWCSRACGDRARVARHYRKHRPDAATQSNA
jgi:predicted RNA-binding Zn ribbon-like protein